MDDHSRIERLADEMEIRGLHHAYADVVTRRSWTELADLFTADAVVTVDVRTGDPHRLDGAGALGEFIGGAVARFDFFELALLSARVFIAGDTASGRMYMQEVRHDASSGRWSTAYGLYQDHYRRTGDGWRFSDRAYSSLARTGPDLQVFAFPADAL